MNDQEMFEIVVVNNHSKKTDSFLQLNYKAGKSDLKFSWRTKGVFSFQHSFKLTQLKMAEWMDLLKKEMNDARQN